MPLVLALLLALASACVAQEPPPAPAPVVTALVGGRILTMAGEPIDSGTVVITDGKVTSVGSGVAIPEGAQQVDVTGMTVLPGLIDAASRLYLHAEDLYDGNSPVASHQVVDGLDLFTEHTDEVLRAGVTTVHVTPGSVGVLAGLSALVRVGAAPGSADVVRAPVGVRGHIGVPQGAATASLARLNDYAALREALLSARDYLFAEQRYERQMATFERKLAASQAEGEGPKPPRPDRPAKPGVDPNNEVLCQVLAGELPLLVEAHRVPEILNALRLVDEFHVRLVLLGCSEGYKVAAEIAQRKAAVIALPEPAYSRAGRLRFGQVSPANAAVLASAGVEVVLGVGGDEGLHSRFVRAAAASAVAGGMDPKLALAAVTSTAARVLGAESRTGTIAEGRDADLVVIQGDPLDVTAPVRMVFVSGKLVYQREAVE